MADGRVRAVSARGNTPTRAPTCTVVGLVAAPVAPCGRACRLHGRADQRRPPLVPKSERGPFYARYNTEGDRRMADDRQCQWYARCTNDATLRVPHPILGVVPTCDRCADRHELRERASAIDTTD